MLQAQIQRARRNAPGAEVTLGVLVAFLRDERRAAVYKVPEQPMLLPALPHHPVGKVLQR